MNTRQDRARLLWACRRGMLELDTLLIPYVEDKYRLFSPEALSALERVLEQADQDLYDQVLGMAEPGDEAMKRCIQDIRTHRIIRDD